jgi:hypothetical protein
VTDVSSYHIFNTGKEDISHLSTIKKRTYQQQRRFPNFGLERRLHMGRKITNTLARHRYTSS